MNYDQRVAKVTFYAIAAMCSVTMAGMIALVRLYH